MPNRAEKRTQIEALLRDAERSKPAVAPPPPSVVPASRPLGPVPMAIVGLAGKYPGAETIDDFWANLIGRRNCIQEMRGERAEEFARLGGGRNGQGDLRIKHFGLLQEIHRFDAPFFNISRREAEVMDPHMRLLLETVWTCIENAGYRPRSLDPQTGVFTAFYNYEFADLLRELEVEAASEAYLAAGTTGAIFANRISFLLGLNGPSEVYNTACSTALVALHRSIQAICAGDCRQAIIAGVSLLLTPGRVVALSGMGILNTTGVCNPYSHPAHGEVIGEGVGAILIKPLAQAVADRDYIYAVVRGTDVNHPGDRSGRLTLPSADALADLLAATYRKLGIRLGNLRYVEGHGAGAEADVIELRALQRFLEKAGFQGGKVPVGSVKGNIGFGEASGGMAQLAKCALAFHHGQLPGTLHFEQVDPVFALSHSWLEIQTANATLEHGGAEDCMSILAYGLGGSNAHVVVSGYTPLPAGLDAPAQPYLMLFSAGSEGALAEYLRQLGEHLRVDTNWARYRAICGSDSAALWCVARTLAGRERHAPCRLAFLVDTVAALQQCLVDYLAGTPNERIIRSGEPAAVAGWEPGWAAGVRWVNGENAAAEDHLGGGAHQKLPLPGIPFCGDVYRLPLSRRRAQPARLNIEDRWVVTQDDHGTAVELELSREDYFIAQHLVEGVAIMPAAGYLALLFRIARQVLRQESGTIENLAWIRPLEIQGGPATMRFEMAESGAFRIYHKELDRLCCKGRWLRPSDTLAAGCHSQVQADQLEGRVPVVDQALYWAMANAPETRQFHGPALRRLAAIHQVGDQLVGIMDPLDGEASLPEIAFIDSALGTCRGFSLAVPGGAQAVVPFAVERIHWLRPVDASRKGYAAVKERRDALGRYDISIENGAGEVYAVLEGYYPKPFTRLAPTGGTVQASAVAPVPPPKAGQPLRDCLLSEFRQRIAAFLKCQVAEVPLDESLAPLGLDSIGINTLTDQISQRLGFDLPATVFFEYAHLRDLVEYLVRDFPAELEAFAAQSAGTSGMVGTAMVQPAAAPLRLPTPTDRSRVDGVADIAVVGMGGLFPGARNVHELWEKISSGQDLIIEMPEPRRQSVYRVYADALRDLKGIYGGFVEDADKFDAAFFGFTEAEVMAMDPQQRLFLEAAWAAIEDAGYFPPALSGRKVGVYVGAIVNDYSAYLNDVGYPVSMFHEGTGSSLAGIANRLSYFLNWTGPSQAVDTACCSSLYAIDRAVNDLLKGDCEAALAGGVSFVCTAGGYEMYAAMDYLAKDWRCKAFAAGGNGWSKAELFGAVFLKRLEDAIRDRDPIYAVIKATGTNHGGKGYFYTQPNSGRHVELMREVYRKAQVDPRSIIHIEAHGSGTEMGDALEFNSISRALREFAAEQGVELPANRCGLGSIKSNFGHAEAGAGIAGFIKTVLLLHERSLPPTLHIENVNPHLRLSQSPLFLVDQARTFAEHEGATAGEPHSAGVHSFNFSGAAAHALVAEYRAGSENGTLGLSRFPVCISAKTPRALAAYCRELAQFLKKAPAVPGWFDRAVFTINRTKSFFPCRRGFIVYSAGDLIAQLEAEASSGNNRTLPAGSKPARSGKADYPPLGDGNVEWLVERWLGEADFDWSLVLKPFSLACLHLPTYPFEHDRSYFPQAAAGAVRIAGRPEAVAPIPSAVSPPVPVQRAEPVLSGTVEQQLAGILGEILAVAPSAIDLDQSVGEYGFDSLKIVALSAALNKHFGLQTVPPDLFEFSTPREMVALVSAADQTRSKNLAAPTGRPASGRDDIAIIGMSGQFPGASDLEQFWQNLVAGRDSITEIPPDRWDWKSIFGDPRREDGKTNVRWGGFIEDVPVFDPLFFHISPLEAQAMDPQQRLLMMYVWRAIEDAGYRPSSLAGSHTGLFIGTGSTAYSAWVAAGEAAGEGYSSTGSIPSMGPNRMSHFLDLHGPSEPVETSCSSSLVAIHRAVSAIKAGECDLAIAGGINTIITPDDHIGFSKAGMLCEDGRCKTFSAAANGYVRGEGVGMLVLKSLSAAEADGDPIYGVIRSSVVNHGGRATSLTAPNPKAQAELLRAAYAKAGIDPWTIGYIEAHGTGTPLGDPIEVNALTQAFQALYAAAGAPGVREAHCALASVKTNIGHLELAAGVAGVIKVLLQLRHGLLVQGLHCERINPYIKLEGTPFYLLPENRPWPQVMGGDGRPLPRRAGVSSFGFGGVNAHLVLEEYVPPAEARPAAAGPLPPPLVLLSARNPERLQEAVANLHGFLRRHPGTALGDLAYTLQIGREEMEARLALSAGSIDELQVKLQQVINGQNDVEGCLRGLVAGPGGGSGPASLTLRADSQTDPGRLASHWVNGGRVDWCTSQAGCRRIRLPAYPFARERYWRGEVASAANGLPAAEPEATVFIPQWEDAGSWVQPTALRAPSTVVIVESGTAFGLPQALAEHCRQRFPGAAILRIQIGDQTGSGSPGEWRCGRDDAGGFEACLGDWAAIDTLFFIANEEPLDPDWPAQDEVQLLRLAKAVKRRLSGASQAACFILTVDNYRVADSAVHPRGGGLTGLAYAIAQGDHRLQVRNIDLSAADADRRESLPALLDAILSEPPSHRGEVIKFFAGQRYRQTLIPLAWPGGSPKGFRPNEVYVILGGSGLVGDLVTRILIQRFQARIIWLGRSPEDHPGIRARLDSYQGLPGKPIYRQADALDLASLRGAVERIRGDYGEIHGALFAGNVFSFDNSVAETTELDFTRILGIKTKGSLNFVEAFKEVPLGFMCFFSSAQAYSFSGAAALSAYAAGITFTDSLVRSLGESAAFPVGTVNWGFWESSREGPSAVGNAGFLDAATGVDALDRFIGLLRERVLSQILCRKTSPAVRGLMPIHGDRLTLAVGTVVVQNPAALARAGYVGYERPPLADIPGADEFEAWMVKLLEAQMRDMALPAGEEAAVTPGLRMWLRQTRRLLEEKRALVDASAGAASVWAAWELRKPILRQERQLQAQILLAEECLRKLPAALRGEIRPTEILFPAGSMEKVEPVYADNSQFTYFSTVVADAVLAFLEQRREFDPGCRVRILEIGAGTGGTTAVVLASLRGWEPFIEEYCYTDVSHAFLAHGERRFASGRPFLKFRLLDIEQAPAGSEEGWGTYDLVLAANVLHATQDIRRTIRHAKAALKRHGQLILDEIAGPSIFAHLTFGLLPGWWRFEDSALRIPGSPGLYPETWQRVLREEGFETIAFPAREAHRFGQQVIVAGSDGVIRLEKRAGREAGEKTVEPREAAKPTGANPGLAGGSVKQRITGILSEFLRIPESQLLAGTPFSDYGVDSILGINFVDRLSAELGLSLNSAILFEHSTIDRLSAFLAENYPDQVLAGRSQAVVSSAAPIPAATAPKKADFQAEVSTGEIAVIGMAGQFPGAKDVESLWRNLVDGQAVVQDLPAHYLDAGQVFDGFDKARELSCRRGGILEDRACFDPLFFNISPREAESMNPHQRLILQESWKALEDAGINPRSLGGAKAGLFIGAEPCGYEHESFTGASDAIIASRLSYFLDLKGPALVVNTGCSSSATAIHLACESLRQGESQLAIAGGVFAVLGQELLVRLSAMDMLSLTSACHSFDAEADGTVFSEGVGVVVLKRLADAIADGDPIYGVIPASGMNQDGASNGITAPNGKAQESLLVDVYRRFHIDPERFSYVEAHGTGTRLGDPVEANALARAFGQFTARRHFCAVGSVKAALGHTSAAAGVIGLIKVLLMMRHGKLPGMPHFKRLNPLIEFENSAFYVNETVQDWPAASGQPRFAAVNSFGHSGTNVHLVVRSHEVPLPVASAGGPQVIVLSAKDGDRLKEAAGRLAAFVDQNPTVDLRALACTLQVGRESMRERLALIVDEAAELPAKLKAWIRGEGPVAACWRGTADPADRALQLLQTDEASRDLPARWMAQGKLDPLAELWTLGADVDWQLLYQHDRPVRLRLPTYPFAREHYWAPKRGPGSGSAALRPRPPAEEERILCFEENWEPLAANASPLNPPANRIQTLVCLLSDPQHQEAFSRAMHALAPSARVVFLGQADVGPGRDAEAFGKAWSKLGPGDAFIYLWPVEDRRLITDILPLAGLLQAVSQGGTKPGRVIFAGGYADGWERCHLESWIGIERSLGLVLPEVQAAVLAAQAGLGDPVSMATWADRIWRMLGQDKLESVRYEGGIGHALRFRELNLVAVAAPRLDGKTLLITGGGGGLGLRMAKWLAAKWRVNLVLTGRSPWSADRQGMLDGIQRLGCRVHYGQADVCDAQAMAAVLQEARNKLGPIHGVIHAAGIKDTRTVFEKSPAELQAVMDPKVKGTLVLDEVLAQDPLEFVCYCSSSAAILGDFGACDYAMGNRFQMAYAAHRNLLAAEGRRQGRTCAICWTMWRGTGMGSRGGEETALGLKASGQRPLDPEEGLELFGQLLAQDKGQCIVLAGRAAQVRRALRCDSVPAAPVRNAAQPAGASAAILAPGTLEEKLLSDLGEQLSQLFKIPTTRLGSSQNFADFGIDSIGLAELARLLSKRYGIELSPSVFFGHSTLDAVTRYLSEKHAAMAGAFFNRPPSVPENRPVEPPPWPVPAPAGHQPAMVPEPIAIIGMSGRFPGARGVEEMWQILFEGRNAVTEMPADRFEQPAGSGGLKGDPAQASRPSCGCIPGVREFDPVFFEISPAEAEEMDPRQRLLLQEGWNALEDAGFGPEQLARQRIGMFVGVEEGDYPRRAAEGSITANHTGILAARLAYFLNLKGPVMAINTSCSSSLVAVHQACQTLRSGECDAVLAAGVNLILNPDNLLAMAQAGMLSPDGTCFAFDRRASGMVPGEAVVAIVLKPFRQAVADGDPIHAVILGSGINYDGKTNGITAPSGVAQAELLRKVWEKAGIQPQQMEYIVAHGTGTRLGDPVEVNALAEAFHGAPAVPASCALTSCKTNFGHTFAASGLVSLVALVQAMRHQTIPASLHCREPNEFIHWEGRPFYVSLANQTWRSSPGRARIGGVSAFGMSGTNAHVVVRDHAVVEAPQPELPGHYLLAWSAKTAEALRERILQFVHWVETRRFTNQQLPAISRTLLLGRHSFAHRCAVVVRHLEEAVEALAAFEATGAIQESPRPGIFKGTVEKVFRSGGTVPERDDLPPAKFLPADGQAAGLADSLCLAAEQWCRGAEIDWAQFLDPNHSQRLHLPGYPFSRRSYWLESGAESKAKKEEPMPARKAPTTTWWQLSVANAEAAQQLLATPAGDMDRHLAGLLAATLHSLGLREEDQRLVQSTARKNAPAYLERWLEESRRLLGESGESGAGVRPLASVWAEWDAAKVRWMDDACLKAQASLVEHCLRALPEILRGERRATDVLFPDYSVELVEAVYRNHPVADLFNDAVGQAAAAWIEHRLGRDPGARIRVLEIGAGTGGTTAAVLPLLAPFKEHLEEYCYTDISKAFLIPAGSKFVPAHPFVVPRLFDVSQPVAGQGIAPYSYDLVIAANVLHATPDIRRAIRNAGSTLRPGGVLILNELSANGWFTHLTFGLLEGWWLHQDEALRLRGCPAVASDTWHRLLTEEGFVQVHFPLEQGHGLGQQVIVAEKGGALPGLPMGGLGGSPEPASAKAGPEAPAVAGEKALSKLAIDHFKQLVGAALKMAPNDIDPAAPLEGYGMDSLMIGKVMARLREAFEDIPSTLLFEIQTVAALAEYFLSHRKAEMMDRLGFKPVAAESPRPAAAGNGHEPGAITRAGPPVAQATPAGPREAIAIIGMSGHFPSAPDLGTYWENLKAGKDCITEIPPERWSLDGFFHPDMEEAIEAGKSYCKWGGFLEGFWNFDPLFFNLSPRLALEMDPQERLFVQAAWEALEDAGYTRDGLARQYDGRVGVFTGVSHTEFNVLGPDLWRAGQQIYPRTSFGSVANRVSFLFNLKGPSVPVDTMCSSALTAIHAACESILRGECALAIAGAVNLCLHPSTYVALCASRLLSKSAKCCSFGLGDDGYVPAEGVGVLLLKKFSEAVRDRDRIHAIIRGTAVNHGGRTNGYTVPNPNAQAEVIRQALDQAGVNARTVSYVETHGAGTKLGDPIEVLGLTRAFRQDTRESGFCAMGSVKSNVGHLEAAAGMAGITKVILQMQHQQLVPSLHSAQLNPDIKFEETPFIVQQKLEPWQRPVLEINGVTVDQPRLAGISAFGAGGSNAHVIVEEYEDVRPACSQGGPCLVVLSARNQSRLKEMARALRQFVSESPDLDLADLAYTLQIGREAMEERVGFVVEAMADLPIRLTAFLEGKPDVFTRLQSRVDKAAAERFLDEADLAGLVSKWVETGDYIKILEVWIRGYGLNWNQLYPAGAPRRIGLPTYPFAKEKYWFLDTPPRLQRDELAGQLESPEAPADSWLVFREEWAAQELPDPLDWRERLAGQAGKHVAIAAVDPAEAEAVAAFLRQLEAESLSAPPLRISILGMDPESRIGETPEVVLFLGPGIQDRATVEPSEEDLSAVFHLSRRLMNSGWDEPVAIYYLYEGGGGQPRVDCEALAGFLRAAMKENEQHIWTLIGDYSRDPSRSRPQLLVKEWLLGSAGGGEIRYAPGQRLVRRLAETSLPPQARLPFKEGGVYLLAGGLGYLGRQLSLELARRYKATLVLLTRGARDESRAAHCRQLEALGAKVLCESVDITDRDRLAAVYAEVIRRVGPLNGVFHLARHHEDQLIARKPWPSFLRVIQPKAQGMLYLDELTQDQPLDFFAVFSSLGAYGVRGASDYSYATAFQNAFSTLRNQWVREGRRSGATTALCWGPWVEDHLFPESRSRLVDAGFALIEMGSGFQVLGEALAGGVTPLGLVKIRDGAKVRGMFGLAESHPPVAAGGGLADLDQLMGQWEQRRLQGEDVSEAVAERITLDELNALPEALIQRVDRLLFGTNGKGGAAPAVAVAEAAQPKPGAEAGEVDQVIRTLLAEVLHLTEIDDERSFMDYGLDSIAGMQLAVRLEKRLKKEVSPQSLIGFPTVAELAKHLVP